MPVITIRGSTGSGAHEIGRQVAALIGGDYVDRQVIAQVAELLKRPEDQVEAKERISPRLFERIVDPLRRVMSRSGRIESAYSRTVDGPLNDADYISALEAVIRDLALELNMVIVGRGSQHILRNNRSVLHVLVVAPFDDRLGKVMADRQVDRPEALRHMEETDASRRAFVGKYFHKEVENPLLYDLVINTRYITFDVAARLAVSAATDKNPWR
jgi:hypothetical protein